MNETRCSSSCYSLVGLTQKTKRQICIQYYDVQFQHRVVIIITIGCNVFSSSFPSSPIHHRTGTNWTHSNGIAGKRLAVPHVLNALFSILPFGSAYEFQFIIGRSLAYSECSPIINTDTESDNGRVHANNRHRMRAHKVANLVYKSPPNTIYSNTHTGRHMHLLMHEYLQGWTALLRKYINVS